MTRQGCNEIFMQSQRVLAAENAKDARLMPRSRPASGLSVFVVLHPAEIAAVVPVLPHGVLAEPCPQVLPDVLRRLGSSCKNWGASSKMRKDQFDDVFHVVLYFRSDERRRRERRRFQRGRVRLRVWSRSCHCRRHCASPGELDPFEGVGGRGSVDATVGAFAHRLLISLRAST